MAIPRSCGGVVEAEDVSECAAVGVFGDVMTAFRYYARNSRIGASGTIHYGSAGGAHIHPNRVMPQDWLADVHLRGKLELGDGSSSERIWSLHFCMGLDAPGCKASLGIFGSAWNMEIHRIKVELGRAFVRCGLWPIHDRVTRLGYLD